jgi:NAD(P)-dependent dehydrogenase (short-subunit alcohol dehydrogenase family)
VKFFTSIVSLLILMMASLVPAEEVELKPVLITGASSGIGLRVTEVLSKNGYWVYAGARKEEDLKRLNEMENVESVRLDVTIQSDIDAAVKFVSNKGRGLYGVVNNAGVVIMGPLIEVPIEELEWLFDVNVYGPYRITQSFASLIIESRGRIVNISSIHGIYSDSLSGHYSMSKHAVEAYTDSLAAEMDRFGVKVSVIEPGSFASNAGEAAIERLEEKMYWDKNSAYKDELVFIKSITADSSSGKDPTDVAKAIMHALSSETPKRRYLVADAQTTHIAINNSLKRVLQLNQDQANTKSRGQLIKALDSELQKLN